MLPPLSVHCSVERHALATFEVEQVVTYRELTRYKNEIHALLVVLFPEFTQVFADPSRPSALTVLKAYLSAQALREAEPRLLHQLLREQCPGRYGRKTADKLIHLAKASVSVGVAIGARSSSMRILCDQLDHTQKNLELLLRVIEHLLDSDPKARSVLAISELVCWPGSSSETKWAMERADETVQTRQRPCAPYPRAFPLSGAFVSLLLPLACFTIAWWTEV